MNGMWLKKEAVFNICAPGFSGQVLPSRVRGPWGPSVAWDCEFTTSAPPRPPFGTASSSPNCSLPIQLLSLRSSRWWLTYLGHWNPCGRHSWNSWLLVFVPQSCVLCSLGEWTLWWTIFLSLCLLSVAVPYKSVSHVKNTDLQFWLGLFCTLCFSSCLMETLCQVVCGKYLLSIDCWCDKFEPRSLW